MAPPDPNERFRNFVQAIYDFTDEEEVELNFRAGDIIEILDKDEQSSGWWFGLRYGTEDRGWFPSNYVARIARGGDEENINGEQEGASAQG